MSLSMRKIAYHYCHLRIAAAAIAAVLLCISTPQPTVAADTPVPGPTSVSLTLALPDTLDTESFEIDIALTPGGPEHNAHLSRVSLRSPEHFRVRTQQADGSCRILDRIPLPATYRGTFDDNPAIAIFGSLNPETGLSAWIIDNNNPDIAWRLEPIDDDDDDISSPRHRITMIPGGLASAFQTGSCGLDENLIAGPAEFIPPDFNSKSSPQADLCTRTAEIAFDADYEMYRNYDYDAAAVLAAVEETLLASEFVYARDLQITYVITEVIIRTDIDDPYSGNDAGTILTQFQNEWNTNQAHIVRDMAHLFTGRPRMNGGIIGLAYVGVVCNTGWAYGLTRYADVGVLTHELGHNWGAGHCHDDPCVIMCGGCLEFGENATDIILGFKYSRACLDETGAYVDPAPPRARPESAATLDTVVIDVLANDFDANCQQPLILSFEEITPNNGTVTLSEGTGENGRDELIYEADPAFEGVDTFTYTIIDDDGLQDSALVTVDVLTIKPPVVPRVLLPGATADYYELDTPEILPDFTTLQPYKSEVVTRVEYPSYNGWFAGSEQSDHLGAVFAGYIDIPADDLYYLSIESDDGSALYLDGNLLINNDGRHGMTEIGAHAGLAQGYHEIRIEFFEYTGTAGLIARIESETLPRQPIPDEMWSYDPGLVLEVEPLYENKASLMTVNYALPRQMVYFAYSLKGEGATYVPQLDVTLDIDQPRLAGQARSSDFGLASLRVRPPSGTRFRILWVQAAAKHVTSNMILTQVN